MKDVRSSLLEWNDSAGVGYFPVVGARYDKAYWEIYQGYRKSPIADRLMDARARLVARYHGEAEVVDIGIGSGHFIECRKGLTYGYDVNPFAIRWLLDNNLWWDPYFKDPIAVTFWDSLEHMAHPKDLLCRVSSLVFISIPIFRDKSHALASKHFKPAEHYWYFTEIGLERWMGELGFLLIEKNRMESDLGRDDIESFVFANKRP